MSSSFMDSFDQQQAGDSSVGSSAPFVDSYEPSPTPIYVSGGGFSADAAESSQEDGAEPLESGPILPPPSEMLHEEGYALREWRRGNAIRLEEKEKREKELLAQILVEAEEYKTEFHKKRQISCETNRASNRDREKVVLAEQEKFHAEVDKNYWKSVADLIPKEVPTIAKKGKKEQEKKPPITVIQGPKPGKPTDLSRMRHILLKLKHNTPDHLKPSPAPVPTTKSDTVSTSASASASASEPAAVIVSQKQVAVA